MLHQKSEDPELFGHIEKSGFSGQWDRIWRTVRWWKSTFSAEIINSTGWTQWAQTHFCDQIFQNKTCHHFQNEQRYAPDQLLRPVWAHFGHRVQIRCLQRQPRQIVDFSATSCPWSWSLSGVTPNDEENELYETGHCSTSNFQRPESQENGEEGHANYRESWKFKFGTIFKERTKSGQTAACGQKPAENHELPEIAGIVKYHITNQTAKSKKWWNHETLETKINGEIGRFEGGLAISSKFSP